MLAKLRELLTPPAGTAPDPAARERLAVAALLVEIARADFHASPAERAHGTELLARHFGLAQADAVQLLTEAEAAVDESVSLYEFTRTLHRNLDAPGKQRVITLLWELALGDAGLDRYEDYLIGKIAELLYVPRGDVIRLKVRAVERREAGDRRS